MSLAKRAKRKASQMTVNVQAEPKPPPATAPMPPTAEAEPLGAHGSAGNTEARAAFLSDTGFEGKAQSDAPSVDEDSPAASTDVPGMSIAQIATIATVAIDVSGQLVGDKLLKRPDVGWGLADTEKQNVNEALVPVLEEALKDTKVTPLHALIGILLACYAPRVMTMAMTKPPASQTTVDAPPAAPPPTAPPAEPQVIHTAPVDIPAPPVGKNGRHGW